MGKARALIDLEERICMTFGGYDTQGKESLHARNARYSRKKVPWMTTT